jgi:RHS repeat-associated protein
MSQIAFSEPAAWYRPRSEALCIAALAGLFAASCGGQVDPNAEGGDSAAVTLSISLTNQIGRVTAHGNGAAHAFHSYDGRGRELGTQHILNNASYTYTMTYGFPCSAAACTATTTATNGPDLVSVKFPDSEVVAYTFDASGARQSIKSTPSGGTTQTIVSRVLRNSRGQTTEVDYGDGTSTTHHYNDTTDLRPNQLETFLTATPTTILQLYTYAFDHNGNVTGINDYCNEASTGACSASAANTTYTASYQYDSRDQLKGTTRGGVAYPYVYDALGNLTNKENIVQTYFPSGAGKPQPHAVSSVGAVAYHYDPNGNLLNTTGGTANPTITWNADNMPVTLVYSTGTTNKDFVGESLWRKRQMGVTTYYLPSVHVENGLYRKFYDSFAERDISDKTTCTVNPTFGCLKFYHRDHLNSSTLVTNAQGSVVHRQAYKPYGDDVVATAAGPFTPELQYNGMEKEKDGTGYYDYGARLYNPAIGRFLSPDSVDAGPNRYAYVSNNPLRYTDPTGHQQQESKTFINQYGEIIIERPDQPCPVHGNLPPRASMRAATVADDPMSSGRAIPGALGIEWWGVGLRAGSLAADLGVAAFRGVTARFAAPAVEAVTETATETIAHSPGPLATRAYQIAKATTCNGRCDVKAVARSAAMEAQGIPSTRATLISNPDTMSYVWGPEPRIWKMHTAPAVFENGQHWVIDDWIHNGPVTFQQWAEDIGGEATLHNPAVTEIYRTDRVVNGVDGWMGIRPVGSQ